MCVWRYSTQAYVELCRVGSSLNFQGVVVDFFFFFPFCSGDFPAWVSFEFKCNISL